MRIFFCVSLFVFSVISMSAQDNKKLHFPFNEKIESVYKDQVRIHIFYNPDALIGYRLYTSLEEEGIRLRNNDYVLLVTNEEKINFFRNTSVNNLPIQLKFEHGKDYYFRIGRSSDGVLLGNFTIDELNQRAFKMELFINNKEPKPEIYDFSSEEL